MSGDVIDITDLVSKLTSSSISIETDFAMTEIALIPYLGPVLIAPVINIFTRAAVQWVLSKIMNGIRQQAFFLNTAIRKASQAHDYVDAVNRKQALLPSASDAEYKKAEVDEETHFNNLVRVTA